MTNSSHTSSKTPMHSVNLNIIGTGHVGKTLGKLWHQSGVANINMLFNRSLYSGQSAAEFIEAGTATAEWSCLCPSPFWLISTTDASITPVAQSLAEHGKHWNWKGTVVFHTSGALNANALKPLAELGAHCASVHPVHSFADPLHSLSTLPESLCAAEGHLDALNKLEPWFTRIGCQWLPLTTTEKMIYHAGSVMACNYLVTLMEVSRRCLAAGGVPETKITHLLKPLVMTTLDNIFTEGSDKALTGPIARGDAQLVNHQWKALKAMDEDIADLYQHLGKATVDMAKSHFHPDTLNKLQAALIKDDKKVSL
ncbi:Rossmann-like and DUF2520 domain-containing protein [Marinibactrum halimedae]|uniref:NADP oxidoreductase n=1 Tax=Marinibactrum halimedae TaxID=1444977 RepID=A0AA37TBF3_9GAMM|nr:Rossmann-like and DUF2520 domain-containing protein [Marinibactrum halimedae]MCD9461150.1 DUF2520 domain-containing protein [Marinibactrum halimedae]GLS26037.1 NADP oxidoreductase [Marinibactrum halimedae]